MDARSTHRIARTLFAGTLMLAAVPASAAEYVATYSGVVTYFKDGLGLFGSSTPSLVGQEVSLTFTDYAPSIPPTAFPGAYGVGHTYGDYEYPSGTAATGTSVLKTAEKTITLPGSVSPNTSISHIEPSAVYNIEGIQTSAITTANYYGSKTFAMNASVDAQNLPTSFLKSADFTVPIDTDINRGNSLSGDGLFSVSAPGCSGSCNSDVRLTFDITHITTRVSGAPEPASWAMMAMGLGGIGFATRKRRGRPVALPARA